MSGIFGVYNIKKHRTLEEHKKIKEEWEKQKNEKIRTNMPCARHHCKEFAHGLSYVSPTYSNKEIYVVPLCYTCSLEKGILYVYYDKMMKIE